MPWLRLALLAPLFLTACGSSLSGDWEGELDCGSGSSELEMSLESAGDGEFEGYLTTYQDVSGVESGVEWRVKLDLTFEMVIETDGAGEQELDYDGDLDDIECRYFENGDEITRDCEDLGFDPDERYTLAIGELTWDGADTIEIEDDIDDCAGELER